MENKYYSPEIKDLLMLQEVEYLYEDEWLKGVVTGITVFELTIHNELLDKIAYVIYNPYDIEPVIRIKYLDREDIESLGFEFDEKTEENVDIYFNKSKEFMFGFCNDFFNRNIVFIRKRKVGAYFIEMFYGTINNKSELKKVLKMIGYEL